MSKGYTINYFIKLFTNTTNSELKTKGVDNVVSPRYGSSSVKVDTLDNFLDYKTLDVTTGSGQYAQLGKTPRARILKALKLRKKNGSF